MPKFTYCNLLFNVLNAALSNLLRRQRKRKKEIGLTADIDMLIPSSQRISVVPVIFTPESCTLK